MVKSVSAFRPARRQVRPGSSSGGFTRTVPPTTPINDHDRGSMLLIEIRPFLSDLAQKTHGQEVGTVTNRIQACSKLSWHDPSHPKQERNVFFPRSHPGLVPSSFFSPEGYIYSTRRAGSGYRRDTRRKPSPGYMRKFTSS